MKTFAPLTLLFSALLVLAACSPAQPFNQLAANQLEAIAEDGDELASALFASPSDISMQAADRNLPGPLANFMAMIDPQQASVECFIDANSSADLDGDTVPADTFFSADCTFQDGPDTVTLVGTMTAQDDDNDPTSGYDITISDFEFRIQTATSLIVRAADMAFDLDKLPGNSYSASHIVDYTKIGPIIGTATLSFDGVYGYTPDDAGDPFAAGTLTLDDLLAFTHNANSYSVTRISNDLHFSSACATDNKFDAGTVTYADSGGNTLVVTYTACGTATGTFTPAPAGP